MHAWSDQARQQLCEADIARTAAAPVQGPKDWAENEFGKAEVPDERLRKRLLTIARDLYARPQAQIPEACQSPANTEATYRFFDHPKTAM